MRRYRVKEDRGETSVWLVRRVDTGGRWTQVLMKRRSGDGQTVISKAWRALCEGRV